MVILKASVKERQLEIFDVPTIASWTNIDKIEVEFDEEWDGFAKTIAFEQGNVYQTVALENGVAWIPSFTDDKPVKIGVIGEKDQSRITSTIDRIVIRPSIYKKESGSVDDPGQVTDFWARVQRELDKKQDRIEEISIYELDEMLLSI